MKYLLLLLLVCLVCSSCGFILCGDRGIEKWTIHGAKCYGDKLCEPCEKWVHSQYDCKEICK